MLDIKDEIHMYDPYIFRLFSPKKTTAKRFDELTPGEKEQLRAEYLQTSGEMVSDDLLGIAYKDVMFIKYGDDEEDT